VSGAVRRAIRAAMQAPPIQLVPAPDLDELVQAYGSEAAALQVLLEQATRTGQSFLVDRELPNGGRQQLYGWSRGLLTETTTDPSGAVFVDGPLSVEDWAARPSLGASKL
jgi:hypothetical protein